MENDPNDSKNEESPKPSSSKPTSPLPSPPTIPDFTQDPLDVQPISCYSQIPTPEDSPPSQVQVLPDVLMAGQKTPETNPLAPEKNPRSLKKSVSIVPHTPEKLEEKPRRMFPHESDRRSAANSIVDYNERTPLLAPSSSLPTVVGYDEAMSMVSGYPGPSNHTRSEIGRDELRRKKRKRRMRRHTDRIMDEKHKARPFIASPFMPIPTKFTEPDRRSVSSIPRENRISGGYGSTSRQQEEGLLKQPPSENSSEEDEEEDEAEGEECEESIITQKEYLFDLSSKEWATIIMLALANLCSTVAFSCIAPFYPAEASVKGLTESQVGMVFGVFELTMFITAPIFGKYMVHIGSKKMFVLGLLMTGLTAILFGFLNYLPSGALFFWASLLIRILEALGDAAFVTSSFAISAKCFPGRITVVVGILETFAGLGYTAGPLIGGFLYEFGGFQTPFLVLGVILLIATSFSIYLIENSDDEVKAEGQKGILAMLRIPVIWIMIYAIIVCAISLSFLDPTLSAHLASFQFNLSPTMIGLMFLLCGGIYTISAPIWGLIIDRFHCSTTVMLFGSFATVASMLLIGPAPFLPIEKSLPLIGISLALLGVAAGAQYIPTFQGCLDAVKLAGFEDTFHTYGCVSGLFQSAFAFGAFFGPTVGGFAVERIGFPITTTLIGIVHILFILTVFLFYGTSFCLRRRH